VNAKHDSPMVTRVAVCCSVLQCVAVCCSVLQCVAVCYMRSKTRLWQRVLQCVAVCCSVLHALPYVNAKHDSPMATRHVTHVNDSCPTCMNESCHIHKASPAAGCPERARCSWTHYNTLQHTATVCNRLQHTATHCNILQHTATNYNALGARSGRDATHCNALPRTATHCNTHAMRVLSDVGVAGQHEPIVLVRVLAYHVCIYMYVYTHARAYTVACVCTHVVHACISACMLVCKRRNR